MDLKTEAISYISSGVEIRHVIGNDGVTTITDEPDTIIITKDTGDIVLSKATLGSWTMHMFANVPPE